MNGDPLLYEFLDKLKITYSYFEHPPAATISVAQQYWKDIDATHCKNLFFRNHKGDRHYLVVIGHTRDLNIHELEKHLKQGKLTFASEQRMARYLGVKPGSVTPFGLIYDKDHQVKLFLDSELAKASRISFHPCLNTASLVISYKDFIRFIETTQNEYEYITF